MRLVTYNLWNARIRWSERLDAASEELARLDADVVALQEVVARVGEHDGRDAARYIAEQCGYDHIETRLYPDDPEEGLAFLSKVPLRVAEAGWDTSLPALQNCGLRARVSVGGTEVAITNVHLDWENIAAREAQTSQILEWIEARSEKGCYEVLCGDFNCAPDTSVYRFLMGQQTLRGKGVAPWHDLARYHAERSGRSPEPTLDFWGNPRWQGAPTLDIPVRVDLILLQDVFGRGLPYPRVPDAGVFGTVPTPRAQVVPSDHYGVYADLDFGGQD
jgi:maltose 6'-phosphate phosphatase